jgi:hypothetical protein
MAVFCDLVCIIVLEVFMVTKLVLLRLSVVSHVERCECEGRRKDGIHNKGKS